MLRTRLSSIPFLSLAALLVAALALGAGFGSRAVAQDATPEASPMAMAGEPCGPLTGAGDETVACVNIIHASADAPAVDVLVNGEAAVTNLEFGSATGFVGLPAGTYAVQVTAAGDPSTVAIDVPELTVEAGMAYEVAAVGSLTEGTITAEVLPVNLSPLEEGNARIRVYQAIADAPPVDIAIVGGEVLIPNLMALMGTDYLEVPSTTVDLEVRPAGTTDALFPLPGQMLPANTVTSIYAIGTVSDPSTIAIIPVTVSLDGMDMMATPAATPAA